MKRNIAIVWGGYSSEVVVSEKSMKGIYSFMDKEKYNIYKVKIVVDSWTVETDEGQVYPIDKNDFSFFDQANNKKINIDFAYITIHGIPGEDGRLQGYFDMIQMPYSAPGVLTSALTMNKYVCNKFLKNFELKVADSIQVKHGESYDVDYIARELDLPLFVKPVAGGSSFATFKVKTKEEIGVAIESARQETDDVIIESFIAGREVTCGCYKVGGKLTILPISEVVPLNEFFDFGAKYNGEVEEITPAQLPEDIAQQINESTAKIYDLIGAKGIIRVDYIIKKEGIPFLLEINTTPGMTVTSFIPQQVAAANMKMQDVLTAVIENEFN